MSRGCLISGCCISGSCSDGVDGVGSVVLVALDVRANRASSCCVCVAAGGVGCVGGGDGIRIATWLVPEGSRRQSVDSRAKQSTCDPLRPDRLLAQNPHPHPHARPRPRTRNFLSAMCVYETKRKREGEKSENPRQNKCQPICYKMRVILN